MPPALLIDTSASMRDHDRGGLLRAGVAAAVGDALGAQPARLLTFASRLGVGQEVPARELAGAVSRALHREDSGSTDLAGALDRMAAAPQVPGLIVLVTDAEPPEPTALPTALLGTTFVIATVGGPPPAWLRSLARRSSGAALEVSSLAAARGALVAVRRASGCVAGSQPGGGPASPVVLISGLRDAAREVRGAHTLAACAPALSLAPWCRALVHAGHLVYVPSIGPRGRVRGGGRAVLDSTGRLHHNGVALRDWARRAVPGRAIYVGHSMGGLIAHAGMAWSGLSATGLITVGTPHTGSFGADAYRAALMGAAACIVRCPATAGPLATAAAGVRWRFGAALDDLTHRRRTRVDPLPLLPRGIGLATYGAPINRRPAGLIKLLGRAGPLRFDADAGSAYLLPNDGMVGLSSALGQGRLSPGISKADGTARHSGNVFPPGLPTQLQSAETATFVVDAAARFAGGAAETRGRRLVASRSGARQTLSPVGAASVASVAAGSAAKLRLALRVRKRNVPRAQAKAKGAAARAPGRRRIVAPLVAVQPLDELAPDETLDDAAAVVVSVDPITLVCDGVPVDALAVSPELYVLDLSALGCTSVALGVSAPTTALMVSRPPRAVAVASDEWSGAASAPTNGRVVLQRRPGGAWRLTIEGARTRPIVRLAGARIPVRPVRPQPRSGVARELPAAGRTSRYRAAIGPRSARRGGQVTVTVHGADGVDLAAAVELG